MSDTCRTVLLIADQEPVKSAALKTDLTEAGYEVREAGDAAGGLKSLAARPADVVIVDLRMPEFDGLQLIESLKAQSPRTEVIMILSLVSAVLVVLTAAWPPLGFAAKSGP